MMVVAGEIGICASKLTFKQDKTSKLNNNTNLQTNHIMQEITALVKVKVKNDEDCRFCGFGNGEHCIFGIFIIAI